MNIGGLDLCDVDLDNGVRNPVGSSRHGDLASFPGGTNSRTDGLACDDLRILRARLYLVIGMVKRPEMTRFCWLRPLTNGGARGPDWPGQRCIGEEQCDVCGWPSEALRLLV